MAIITKSQFASLALSRNSYRSLSGYPNEKRGFSKSASSTSIFLSHAHAEKSLIEQAQIFFEHLGISIYVDWADESMPSRTSGITADRIKNKIIRENDKFILLATNAAVASKWCNWEVGIADFHKLFSKKMALLPLAETSGSWDGNEYLQIYPRIESYDSSQTMYVVKYPNGSMENLNDWLNRK